jgi:hypothetical protein
MYAFRLLFNLSLTLHLSIVTHLTNFMFDGARADLSKNLSINPAFQISHSFNLGSQVAAPSYNFGAVYATNSVTYQPLSTSNRLTRLPGIVARKRGSRG